MRDCSSRTPPISIQGQSLRIVREQLGVGWQFAALHITPERFPPRPRIRLELTEVSPRIPCRAWVGRWVIATKIPHISPGLPTTCKSGPSVRIPVLKLRGTVCSIGSIQSAVLEATHRTGFPLDIRGVRSDNEV